MFPSPSPELYASVEHEWRLMDTSTRSSNGEQIIGALVPSAQAFDTMPLQRLPLKTAPLQLLNERR